MPACITRADIVHTISSDDVGRQMTLERAKFRHYIYYVALGLDADSFIDERFGVAVSPSPRQGCNVSLFICSMCKLLGLVLGGISLNAFYNYSSSMWSTLSDGLGQEAALHRSMPTIANETAADAYGADFVQHLSVPTLKTDASVVFSIWWSSFEPCQDCLKDANGQHRSFGLVCFLTKLMPDRSRYNISLKYSGCRCVSLLMQSRAMAAYIFPFQCECFCSAMHLSFCLTQAGWPACSPIVLV